MNSLFIHIGCGKTATSWFQEKLFSKHPKINYFGKAKSNYPEWLIKIHYLDDYSFLQEKESIRKIILKKHKVNNNKISLLSSEPFSNLELVYSQGNRIKELFPNPKIIIFLRNPLSLLKSFYKFNIKEGYFFLDIEHYLDFTRKPFALQKRKPIYLPGLFFDDIIAYYNSLFGKNNICVLKYEEFKENPTKFVDELGSFMGVDFGNVKSLAKEKVLEGFPDKEVKNKRIKNFKEYIKKNFPATYKDLVINEKDFSDEIISSKNLEKKLRRYFKSKCSMYKSELN